MKTAQEFRAGQVANINGSPYHMLKSAERLGIIRARARETGAWIVYVNAGTIGAEALVDSLDNRGRNQ